MKVGVAQTRPVAGDIQSNIDRHKRFVDLAVSIGTELVVFPELSITGYEPTLAKDLAIDRDDCRFDVFQSISDTENITIAIGAPTKSRDGTCISMLRFQPRKTIQLHSKMHLHRDEEPFFVRGRDSTGFVGRDANAALAICYELSSWTKIIRNQKMFGGGAATCETESSLNLSRTRNGVFEMSRCSMRNAVTVLGTLLVAFVCFLAESHAQVEAHIQRTAVPPVIDGGGSDAVWQNATAHGMDEFLNVESEGAAPDDEFDLGATWKALWDDDNLYVLIEVADDLLNNESNCDHSDDSIEIYIDAQNTDAEDYNEGSNPGVPAYQLRSVAGNNIDTFCGLNIPVDNTAFNGGVNSYGADDAVTQYPQGADHSVNVTADQAAIDSALAYSFEVSFPWEALEETPANILARGEFGFGVQVNDSDFSPGTRETMVAWAHDQNDLWQRADAFPSVALSTEVVGPDASPPLKAGDANQDLKFDQLDLVQAQIAAKYLTGQAATWGEGDWNGAPGGEQGSPPQGNGQFDQIDIIAALGANTYLTGPYAAIAPGGDENDEQTSIVYDPATGEVAVNAPASTQLTSINIDSAGSIFTGDTALNLGGSFDNDADNNIFKATFGSSFGSLSFGNVAQAGLSEDFVLSDLTVIGSLAGGGDLGAVDLIYVPEPSAAVLAVVALVGLLTWQRRRIL